MRNYIPKNVRARAVNDRLEVSFDADEPPSILITNDDAGVEETYAAFCKTGNRTGLSISKLPAGVYTVIVGAEILQVNVKGEK